MPNSKKTGTGKNPIQQVKPWLELFEKIATTPHKNFTVQVEEIRITYQNQKTDTFDLYKIFVEFLRTQSYSNSTLYETHHVHPQALGGTESKENKIRINQQDHTSLHFLRYLEYGWKGDLLAILLRQKQTDEALEIRKQLQKAYLERQKQNQ